MIARVKGFVLIEAISSLVLLIFISSLILSWQVSRMKKYQGLHEQLQGLCIARSVIEQLLLKQAPQYPPTPWKAYIQEQRDPLLPLVYVTVTLVHKKDPKLLLTLKSAYSSND